MVSIASILLFVVFTVVATFGLLFLTFFWIKAIRLFKLKNYTSSKTRDLDEDTIYKRMADDFEVTVQYEYMRRKLVGG